MSNTVHLAAINPPADLRMDVPLLSLPEEVPRQQMGVLAVVFNWDGLAQSIDENVRLSPEEKGGGRTSIVDSTGLILADSAGRQLVESIQFRGKEKLFRTSKGYLQTSINAKPVTVGHAKSQGFETYATGWHSVVIVSRPRPGKSYV